MRGLECEMALLNKADGSASFQQGDTKVLCAVYGPAEVKANREMIDKSTLECILKPNVGMAGVKEKAIEEFVSKTCQEITLMTLHPRSAIQIVFQIMQESGSILSVLVNSACMAMVHAGLPMKCMAAAISCAIITDELNEVILDPTKEQEECAKCVMTFVFNTVTMEIISSHTTGMFSIDEYFTCLNVCDEKVREIIQFQRDSISRFLSKDGNNVNDITEDESEVTEEESEVTEEEMEE